MTAGKLLEQLTLMIADGQLNQDAVVFFCSSEESQPLYSVSDINVDGYGDLIFNETN